MATNKVIETVWLFAAFLLVGYNNGILGPTALDLSEIADVSFGKMNYVFMSQGLGFIIGVILGVALENVISLRLHIAIWILIGAVANVSIPQLTTFPLMAIMFGIQGISKGVVDFVALAICNELWESNKRRPTAFFFVTLAGAVGSFAAPFVAAPFVSSVSKEQTMTRARSFHYAMHLQPERCLDDATTEGCIKNLGETQVQYAYIIIGGLCIPPCVAFFYFYIKELCATNMVFSQAETPFVSDASRNRPVGFLVLFFVFHIPSFATNLAYGDLLTSYGLLSGLSLSKSDMILMTSLFWGSNLIGRVMNTLFSTCFDHFWINMFNFVGCFLFGILLTTIGSQQELALWVGTAGYGVFNSAFLPGILNWAGQFLYIDGKIISLCLLASGIGEVLMPVLDGILFAATGPPSFMYFTLATVVAEIILFMAMTIYSRNVINESK